MSRVIRAVALGAALAAGLLLLGATTAAAQAPTLPSDTLQANYAPPSQIAPNPELAPSLPSDTMPIKNPVDWTDSTTTQSLYPGPARDENAGADQSHSQVN
ncbi:MAG TPA: hypothetical protein VIG08_06420 [Gemmatimonadales bacterium]|jgi:hypothetical protein